MTPDQLREMAAWIDADERTRGLPPESFHGFDDAAMLRAHAAALEEVERLNKAWKAQQFHLEAEERESAHWQERAEKAERRAERLNVALHDIRAMVNADGVIPKGPVLRAISDAEFKGE